MKIVKQSVEILDHKNENPQKYIEKIARVCYKSENLITEDSNKRMIKMLYDNSHLAMLEHFIFTYCIHPDYYDALLHSIDIRGLKYIRFSTIGKGYESLQIISFSARAILELYENVSFKCKDILLMIMEQVVFDYGCKELFGSLISPIAHQYIAKFDVEDFIAYNRDINETLYSHLWVSARFICDRGISHELVRHRDASFAQESSRYCNYNKDKFGNEISVIKPCSLKDGSNNPNEEMCAYTNWEIAMKEAETAYFNMLKNGVTPEIARSVLPTSLKTELIITAFYDEWKHIIDLRCDKNAHPDMVSIMTTFKKNMCIRDHSFEEFLNK